MEISIEFISHEKAKDLVSKTPHRPISPEKVNLYKEMMNNNEWLNVQEYPLFRKQHYTIPIILDEDGILWEGKHRIFALAQSNALGYKFVVLRGWKKEKTTEEYQTGEKKFCRWGYLVYALNQLAGNGNEHTKLEDLC
jgi:hypothetical protein